jgi:hypothetical protein
LSWLDPRQRSTVIFVAGAAAILAAGAFLFSRAKPPARCLLYVMNGGGAEAIVSASGETRIAPGAWKRIEIPARKGEGVSVTITTAGREPIHCALDEGVHVVSTGTSVTVETIDYVKGGSGWVNASRPSPVGNACHRITQDIEAVVHGFDEEPPAAITVEVQRGDIDRPRTHFKLRRGRQ